MKKTLLLAALAFMLVSAANTAHALSIEEAEKKQKVEPVKTEVPELNDGGDSLAYEFGAANSDLKHIAQTQFGVDSAYLADFIEGMKEGALEGEVDSAKLAHNMGVEFGRMVKATAERLTGYIFEDDSTKSLNVAVMVKGILDGFEGKVDVAAAQTNFQNKMATIENAKVKSMKAEVPELNDGGDSLAYEFGAANSDLKHIAQAQFGVGSVYLADFIEGMKKSALESEADSSELAHNMGVEFGRMVKATAERLSEFVYENDSVGTLNTAAMLKGIIDGFEGKVDVATAQISFQQAMSAIESDKLIKKYGENKKAGEDFLAENAKKEGVVTTESGLQYKVLVDGKGALPTDSTVVKVKYEGRLIDGTVFDSNIDKDKPFEVNMKYPSVIQGWVEALKLMPAGSKWELYIPHALAYGDRDTGKIKPFSTLIFTIEVLN